MCSEKNSLFYHSSQQYQRIRMKITLVITSRLLLIFPEISGKLSEILNFRKICNPIVTDSGATKDFHLGAIAQEVWEWKFRRS